MNTKKTYFTLLIFLLSITAFAQKAQEIKGDKFYEAYSYQLAIEKLEPLAVKSTEINRKLAESYFHFGDLDKSEQYYATIVNAADNVPIDFYNYSYVLMMNGKYAEAEQWMNKYHQMNTQDSRAVAYTNEQQSYKKLQADQGQFKIHNLDINTEQSDFGTSYYKNKLVFASSREGIRPIIRRWNWNGLAFLDLYSAEIDGTIELSNVSEFDKKINKKYHDGPATFNKDGNFMVFTRNNYKAKDSLGVYRLELYSMEYTDGKWRNEQAFPYNNDNYSVGHGSLTADGKTMYFASDMPGGHGGADIYKATLKQDGSWSEPENLGEKINTEGDELFPFVHDNEGMLFFASNGKVGLGGLDVFVAQLTEGKIGKVENLKTPVNTSKDDFAFVLNANEKSGYFSSNRDGGKGDDDIYSFSLLKPFVFGTTIKGVATDKNNNLLAGIEIKLFDSNNQVIATTISDENGNYSFSVDPDNNYQLNGSKPDYFDGIASVNTNTKDDEVLVNLVLEKDPGLSLYGLVTDKESGEPLEDVKVVLTDNFSGEDVLNLNTENTGDFRHALTDKRLNDRVSYNVVLQKEGYLGKEFTYNKEITKPGEIKLHAELDFALEKIDIGADLAKIIDIKPIYFDLNKHNIRPDAATELDKIVKVMMENPTMVIELGSHTDSRGSNSSNMSLSDRRAKSSADYIIAQGIDKTRISGKGYGESKPNIATAETHSKYPYIPEGQILTEEFIKSLLPDNQKFSDAHQLNRRTEFIIISM